MMMDFGRPEERWTLSWSLLNPRTNSKEGRTQLLPVEAPRRSRWSARSASAAPIPSARPRISGSSPPGSHSQLCLVPDLEQLASESDLEYGEPSGSFIKVAQMHGAGLVLRG